LLVVVIWLVGLIVSCCYLIGWFDC